MNNLSGLSSSHVFQTEALYGLVVICRTFYLESLGWNLTGSSGFYVGLSLGTLPALSPFPNLVILEIYTGILW